MKINWEKISLKDLAGYLSEKLRLQGIDVILVGGACVAIYSNNKHISYDLDFVTYEDLNKVRRSLNALGFSEHSGYFRRKDCPWIVEFVSPPVSIGEEPVSDFSQLKTSFGSIKMLRAIDSIKDRLAAFYHWGDRQCMEQAAQICLEQAVDFKELRRWSDKEGKTGKFECFLEYLEACKKKSD